MKPWVSRNLRDVHARWQRLILVCVSCVFIVQKIKLHILCYITATVSYFRLNAVTLLDDYFLTKSHGQAKVNFIVRERRS